MESNKVVGREEDIWEVEKEFWLFIEQREILRTRRTTK